MGTGKISQGTGHSRKLSFWKLEIKRTSSIGLLVINKSYMLLTRPWPHRELEKGIVYTTEVGALERDTDMMLRGSEGFLWVLKNTGQS